MKARTVVAALLAVCGCKVTVDATINNPSTTQTAYDVAVSVADDATQASTSPQKLSLGSVAAGKSANATVKVKRGGQITMEAALPGSAVVWSSTRSVTDSDPDPLKLSVDITPQGRKMDTLSMDQLRNKLLDLGQGYGFSSASVTAALKTLFGAACVVTIETSKPVVTHLCFTPTQLRNELSLADFQPLYHHVHDVVQFEATQSTALSLSSSFAIYSAVASFNSDSLYRFSSDLTDFGPVAKSEIASFDLDTALGDARKQQIAAMLKAHPKSKFVYINHMWAIRSGKTDVYEEKKLSAGAKVDATSIVTASGAYAASTTSSASKNYNDEVYDFWGEERAANIVKRPGVGVESFDVTIAKVGQGEVRFHEGKGSVMTTLVAPP